MATWAQLYQRQHTGGSGGRGPGGQGINASYQSNIDFWRSLGNFAQSAAGAAQTYAEAVERRHLRDFETQVSSTIRQRGVDIKSTRKGALADNLLEDEQKWLNDSYSKLLQDSGLNAVQARQVWDKYSERYQMSIGTYMLEQAAIAEKESKYTATVEAQNSLVQAPVGDFNQYASYLGEIDRIYGPNSKQGQEAKELGLKQLMKTWAAENPRATLQWFNQNRDQLKEFLGRTYAAQAESVDKIHSQIEREQRRQESEALRYERLQLRAQRQADKDWGSTFLFRLASDDPEFNVKEELENGVAMGVSPDVLLKAYKAVDKSEEKQKEAARKTDVAYYVVKAGQGELTDEDKESLNDDFVNGRIKSSEYTNIMNSDRRFQNNQERAIKPQIKLAKDALKNAISPGGQFGASPRAKDRYIQAEQQLNSYLDLLSDPEAKIRALNVQNPDSYVNLLIKQVQTGVTGQDLLRESLSFELPDYDQRLDFGNPQEISRSGDTGVDMSPAPKATKRSFKDWKSGRNK